METATEVTRVEESEEVKTADETKSEVTAWIVLGVLGTLGYIASWVTIKPSWKDHAMAKLFRKIGAGLSKMISAE